MNQIIEEGRRFASAADMKVSDMSANSPVGTTLAILERTLKVMSAVQARIYYAMKQEFKLLKGIIRDYTPTEYSYEPEIGDRRAKQSDYDNVDVIPVSDPNAASENLNNVTAAKFELDTVLFAGGPTKLFKFNAGTTNLDDVSKPGGYSSAERWSFVQFGNAVLASNDTDKIQAWYVGTSTAFADVAASAPIAKYITVVRDFVVAANISGTANKLQWSDINDETDWTSGGASQSRTNPSQACPHACVVQDR